MLFSVLDWALSSRELLLRRGSHCTDIAYRYFSSLFAASKIFPKHSGVASGASMALFGLSPLFLSVIASTWFTDPSTQILNVARFTGFLSIFSAVVYLSTAYFLHINSKEEADQEESESDDVPQPTESSSLLARDHKPPPHAEQSVATLVSKPEFWLLAVFCLITLGAVSSARFSALWRDH